jgi:hypothetical protein
LNNLLFIGQYAREIKMELQDNTLEVIDGKVKGSAFIPLENGYTVSCAVFSYEYDGNKMNHVPSSVLSDKEGRIVHESELNDTTNAQKAIERAENSCVWLAENFEKFID